LTTVLTAVLVVVLAAVFGAGLTAALVETLITAGATIFSFLGAVLVAIRYTRSIFTMGLFPGPGFF
jgi:hypothetical protein